MSGQCIFVGCVAFISSHCSFLVLPCQLWDAARKYAARAFLAPWAAVACPWMFLIQGLCHHALGGVHGAVSRSYTGEEGRLREVDKETTIIVREVNIRPSSDKHHWKTSQLKSLLCLGHFVQSDKEGASLLEVPPATQTARIVRNILSAEWH